MKLIIDISDKMFDAFKKHGIMAFDYFNEYDKDQIAIAITHGTPYNPQGDAISREALRKAIEEVEDNYDGYEPNDLGKFMCKVDDLIDNAPPVEVYTKDDMAGAYNEGYVCGNKEAGKARPQGEYVDISKLRLMTVEECAGHTIDYAMGWKACIEWIKKGGAE